MRWSAHGDDDRQALRSRPRHPIASGALKNTSEPSRELVIAALRFSLWKTPVEGVGFQQLVAVVVEAFPDAHAKTAV